MSLQQWLSTLDEKSINFGTQETAFAPNNSEDEKFYMIRAFFHKWVKKVRHKLSRQNHCFGTTYGINALNDFVKIRKYLMRWMKYVKVCIKFRERFIQLKLPMRLHLTVLQWRLTILYFKRLKKSVINRWSLCLRKRRTIIKVCTLIYFSNK